jgi:large subunit ribosomal protein L9
MSTQVILTQAVEKLGAAGDAVTVADGFARNFLIPKGLAMPATPANLRRIESARRKREQELAAQREAAEDAAKKLAGHSCTVTAAAGADGKLFGAVTASDVADALKADGLEVDRKKITLPHAIHEVGMYEVEVKLSHDVTAKLKLWVVAGEGASPVPPVAKEAPKDAKKK